MEVGHFRSAENRNQVPIPISTMPPGLPVTNGADDINLLHFSMEAMREMILRKERQAINIDPAKAVKTLKRKNVRISKNPQSVAARHRRERISERIGILGEMVPGGTKMDTATILDEAIRYTKFLKRQVKCLEKVRPRDGNGAGIFGPGPAPRVGLTDPDPLRVPCGSAGTRDPLPSLLRPVQHEHGYGGRLGLEFAVPVEAEEEVWGYHDYMASCMEMGDVLCQQGQTSSGESYGQF